ncbi:hypothetical protein [Natrinema gelatinilyticum]|uniref:hypothetical protein n=1 Tax=Natrinema gelatinilyticum TaxID=2961571 RepID=UPI0020C453C8|nr:hypothetical protein [Natrinema gelatinilyticum]
MTATDLPFPRSGSTVITGPSNVGETRLTARALDAWVESNGTEGVVLFDFGPEFEHDDRILGRHLERFTELSDEN